MEDLLHMSFQLPPYQELNDIYNGKRKAGFSSPDIDYYRLQYLKRYRFSIKKIILYLWLRTKCCKR